MAHYQKAVNSHFDGQPESNTLPVYIEQDSDND
jgi:hypothetical protein